ncbi:immunity 49 family protein [Vibrio diabolicus]|nr:immunity 49 family protein [Vibrio diabolicus]MCG6240504.1 immunity 49 family protein [Vibrio diabolicus]
MSRKVRIERNANPKLTPELVQGYSSDINRDLDMRKDVINVRRENLVALSDEAFEQVRWYTWLPHSIENEQTGTLCLYEASLMRAFYHQLAMRPDEPQSIQLPGYPEVIWKGEGILKTGCLHPNRWLDAYFTSVIVRDKSSMDLLANFPISLMKQSATKAGELSYMLVDVIQSFHNRTSDYPDKLVAIPKILEPQFRSRATLIWFTRWKSHHQVKLSLLRPKGGAARWVAEKLEIWHISKGQLNMQLQLLI